MTLQSLQVLRAFAAWIVVFHHYMQLFHGFEWSSPVGRFFAHYGNFGVDIFFVISGFIMVYALARRRRSASDFAMDRVFRILPAYWAATIVFVLVMLASPEGSAEVSGASPASFVYSLLLIPHVNPGTGMALPLLPVGWTLYFEMYFYALIAFSLFVAGRFWWLFCISVLILLPLTWSWNVNAATFLASRLLWEFVAGMILAGVFLGLRSRVLDMPLIAPVMFLAGAYFLAAGGPVISGQFLPERLLAAGFILVGTLSLDSLVARMRWLSVFIMLGRISYSTYLIHVALLVVMVSLLPVPETLGAEVATLATYALATSMLSYLFYRCFETPLWLSSWKASLRRSNDPA